MRLQGQRESQTQQQNHTELSTGMGYTCVLLARQVEHGGERRRWPELLTLASPRPATEAVAERPHRGRSQPSRRQAGAKLWLGHADNMELLAEAAGIG